MERNEHIIFPDWIKLQDIYDFIEQKKKTNLKIDFIHKNNDSFRHLEQSNEYGLHNRNTIPLDIVVKTHDTWAEPITSNHSESELQIENTI